MLRWRRAKSLVWYVGGMVWRVVYYCTGGVGSARTGVTFKLLLCAVVIIIPRRGGADVDGRRQHGWFSGWFGTLAVHRRVGSGTG